MRLALVARSRDQHEELAATLPAPTLVHVADLSDVDAPATAVATTVSHFERLDLLVNNAGATTRGDFLTLPETDWQYGFELKFFGAMRCCRAAWSHLQATAGAIINVAGIGGSYGECRVHDRRGGERRSTQPDQGAWQTAASQTAFGSTRSTRGPATVMARAARVGRFGSPDEIAAVVLFLASSQAGYLQGSIIDVDGGQTRTL